VSSVEDKSMWYDQKVEGANDGDVTPPPIPARLTRVSPSKTPLREAQHTMNMKEVVKGSPSLNSTHVKGNLVNFLRPEQSHFHRSSPHHNSFHTKLSPSKSHDMLHLKNMYGLNHPLKPYPSTAAVGMAFDNNNSNYAVHHGRLTREHSSLGVSGEGNYSYGYANRFRNSDGPMQFENTRYDRKVTYLTDFPLTQSHSTEHMATVGLPVHNNNVIHSKVSWSDTLYMYTGCTVCF